MNLLTPNPDALLKKWAQVLDQTKHIRTFTTDRELAWLADYATWCSNLVEVGSWRGRSAKVMLMANPGLQMTCIDTWDDPGTYEEFLHNLGPEIAANRVTWQRGPSQKFLSQTAFGPYDGCFIDGGHEEHLVKADIELLRPMMKRGTIMAGHDFRIERARINDVGRGVRSVFGPGEIVRLPCESIWAVQL